MTALCPALKGFLLPYLPYTKALYKLPYTSKLGILEYSHFSEQHGKLHLGHLDFVPDRQPKHTGLLLLFGPKMAECSSRTTSPAENMVITVFDFLTTLIKPHKNQAHHWLRISTNKLHL